MRTATILQYISTHSFFYVKECVGTHSSQPGRKAFLQSTFHHTVQAVCDPLKGPRARSCLCWILASSLISFKWNSTKSALQTRMYPSHIWSTCTQISIISCAEHFWKEDEWNTYHLTLNISFHLILNYPYNSWMEVSVVREQLIQFRCLQYDEGNSTPVPVPLHSLYKEV